VGNFSEVARLQGRLVVEGLGVGKIGTDYKSAPAKRAFPRLPSLEGLGVGFFKTDRRTKIEDRKRTSNQ